MKKIILVCGLISGLIAASMLLVTVYYMKLNHGYWEHGEVFGYSSMLLAFILIFVAIKSYRDQHLGGFISFGQAFLVGLGVCFIASVMYTATWIFIYKNYYPAFMDDMIQASVDHMKQKQIPAEKIQQQIQQMDQMKSWYATWPGLILLTMLEIFPLGLLVSLIAAAILKRRRKTEDMATV